LKVFGHENVTVLNSFVLWTREGREMEFGPPPEYKETNYTLQEPDTNMLASFEDIWKLANDSSSEVQILDARPQGRWRGSDPEPRPGLSSGHVPRSISVPFSDLVDPNTKTLLPAEHLRDLLVNKKGVDPAKPVIAMCGTGVTACVVDLGLQQAGFHDVRVYDGSWTEWASRVDPNSSLIVKEK